MERRELIRIASLMIGYSLSASAVTAVMSGCLPQPSGGEASDDQKEEWKPSFLTAAEVALVAELAETILPETGTPGAKAAGVERYIDEMLAGYYRVPEKVEFRNGLRMVDEQCNYLYGSSFADCSGEQQFEFLSVLDREAIEFIRSANSETQESTRPFFAILKELTWTGFFTSELIGEHYLNYDPVPGAYHGCVPIDETGPYNWSL